MNFFKTIFCLILLLSAEMPTMADSSYEKEIFKAADSLRSIVPTSDKEKLKEYNQTMDDNWSLFSKDKDDSVPVLVRILEQEIESKEPNALVLMDLTYFIALSDKKSERVAFLSKVYQRIDPEKPIISSNSQQFFLLSLYMSYKQVPGFLKQIDDKFLQTEATPFFIPQHVVNVDGHAQRTHLYGAYGKENIEHLLDLLEKEKNLKIKRSLTSILRRICTPICAKRIGKFLETEKDHEIFVNGTYILLDNAGPEGKEVYLKLRPNDLSAKTSDYFKSEQDYVRNQSYEFLISKIEKKFGKSGNSFSKSELKEQIEQMIRNKGASRTIHPLDLLQSDLDKDFLIEKLIEARRNCFLRTNQHGMQDIDINNLILNALYYRN